MVRVIKKQLTHINAPAHASLLDVLAKYIAEKPIEIRAFLKQHQIKISENSNGKETMNQLFFAIEKKGKKFHRALAQLLYSPLEPSANEDTFNMGSLLGKGSEAASAAPAPNSGITVGSDPVSAIAGAIGSVANIFGNHQNRKTLKMQARSKTLQSMLAYKSQKEQQVASKEAASHAQLNQEKIFKMVGIAATIGIIGWLIIHHTRKKHTSLNNQVAQ